MEMHNFTDETHIIGLCNMHSMLVIVYIT